MPYSFTITQTLTPVIEITQQARPNITVTDQNFVFTLTQPPAVAITVTPTTYQFTATTNISQIRTETLATAFRGDWSALTGYQRGDVVRYELAAYICTVANGEVINGSPSNPAPSSDARWVVFLGIPGTGTNALSLNQIRGIQRAVNMDPWSTATTYQLFDWTWSTATRHTYVLTNLFGSLNYEPAQWPQYWTKVGGSVDGDNVTFNNVTVTNLLTVAGVRYPTTNGNLNQVLTTNGENEANWVDIGQIGINTATRTTVGGVIIGPTLDITGDGVLDVNTTATQFIRFWELSSDLGTNGWDITTKLSEGVPLNIGIPNRARLSFDSPSGQNQGNARLTATTAITLSSPQVNITATNINLKSSQNIDLITGLANTFNITAGATNVGQLNANSIYVTTSSSILGGLRIGLSSLNDTDFFEVLSSGRINTPVKLNYGIQFPDGTYQGTAFTGSTNTNAILIPATASQLGGIKIGDGLNVTLDGTTSVRLASTTQTGIIKLGDNLVYDAPSGKTYVPRASQSTLGVIKLGVGLRMNEDGTVDVTTGTFELPAATTAILGGVKIGSGIDVTNSGTISLQKATTNAIGGVTVGSNITVTDGEISIPYASTSVPGVVKVGTGLQIESGTDIRLRPATASSLGGVVAGAGLSVDVNGVLEIDSAQVSSGNVNLAQDARTNGYKIKFNATTGSMVGVYQNNLELGGQDVLKAYGGDGAYMYLGDTNTNPFSFTSGVTIEPNFAEVKAKADNYIKFENNDATVKASSDIFLEAGFTTIKSPITQIGSANTASSLQVNVIRNYLGSGPPLFPDGLQFPDLTVQRSAFQGYDWGGNVVVNTATIITTPLQVARATLEDVLAYTPAEGEPVYSTSTQQLFIGDGVTPGGILVATGNVTSGTNQITNQRLYTGSRVTFASVTATNLIDVSNIHLTSENSTLRLSTGEVINSSYESLLLLGDSLTDLTPNAATATLHGTATIVTVTTGSVKSPQNVFDLPGLAGSYISVPDDQGLYFGTGDFTVDCWFNARTAIADTAILGQWGAEALLFIFHDLGSGPVVDVLFNGAAIQLTSDPVALNQWNHIAVSRQAGVIKIWTNGVESDSTNNSSEINNGTGNFYIGAQSENYANFNGYISHVRVTKGLSLFNDTFTPPRASLFANSNEGDYLYDYELHTFTDASALTTASIRVSSVKFNDGTILSSAGNNNTVTFNGTQLKTTVTGPITTNVATQVDTVNISEFNGIEFLFKIKDGSAMQVSKMLVLYDGTDVYVNEYGILTNTGVLGEFTFGVFDGILSAYFTPSDGDSLTVTSVTTRISV